jgi:uncharacterized protein (DUF488 family)
MVVYMLWDVVAKQQIQERDLVYTLGTSTRSSAEFFSILKSCGIQAIADVRRFPRSKRFPHFNRENLEASAKEQGIAYRWLGEELGGYRSGGYESFKQDGAFQDGLKRLEEVAGKFLTVFICAERLPWKCHRMHIARSLKQQGWNVIHIIEQDRTWQPKEEGRLE